MLLSKLRDAAKNKNSNLLEISVEAALARCTVGEMTSALEEIYGRHTLNSNHSWSICKFK